MACAKRGPLTSFRYAQPCAPSENLVSHAISPGLRLNSLLVLHRNADIPSILHLSNTSKVDVADAYKCPPHGRSIVRCCAVAPDRGTRQADLREALPYPLLPSHL